MGILDDRVAIVTGAGRGIGRGHARLLAQHGARVVVNDVGSAMEGGGQDSGPAHAVVEEIRSAGGRAVANNDDVATFAGAEALIQQAVDEYGRLDILVNNAGIIHDAMSFKMDEETFDSVVNVHLKGHFCTCRFAAEHWRDRAKAGEEVSGRIINTVSESGLDGVPGQANYAAAKGGILSLTLVLARELRNYGVTANCIAPRAKTRMTETMDVAGEFMTGPEWDPDNIAPMVVFLASDAAADVSGQVFIVFGPNVYLMQGWQMVAELHHEGGARWTPEALIAAKDELFAGRRTKVPRMGFGK
ncbi:MAG TPA: SDR family oxidoreductase [Acidimicrobiia bacterium]|jgi:NAD(P)-dependent dehydrogenase (short-subunit alcohol dehydrogenase family)|nr:SDR family oxidoreductase [Acidimicrobiia bacterium]